MAHSNRVANLERAQFGSAINVSRIITILEKWHAGDPEAVKEFSPSELKWLIAKGNEIHHVTPAQRARENEMIARLSDKELDAVLNRRLDRELETEGSQGYKVFFQSEDGTEIYRDSENRTFTLSQIDAIRAQGWRIIRVKYDDAPQDEKKQCAAGLSV